MQSKINIRGVQIDNVDLSEALHKVVAYEQQPGVHAVYTPNAEIMQACIEDPTLRSLFNAAELVIPDGAGVVLASKILKTPLKAKTPGYELGLAVAEHAAAHNIALYFLGGKPGVAQLAAEKLQARYPGLNVAGVHDGYFEKSGMQNDAVCDAAERCSCVVCVLGRAGTRRVDRSKPGETRQCTGCYGARRQPRRVCGYCKTRAVPANQVTSGMAVAPTSPTE